MLQIIRTFFDLLLTICFENYENDIFVSYSSFFQVSTSVFFPSQVKNMFLFPGPMPAGSRPSTLQDIAQGLGLSMGESGSEGPGTGRTSGHVDVCVCVGVCVR